MRGNRRWSLVALYQARRVMPATTDGFQKELRAALGYMMNARIDLETGCAKATAIRTLSGGIARVEAFLKANGWERQTP